MPLDSGEILSRSTQQIRKAAQDMKTAMRELGTGRDAMARDRLRRSRMLAQQCVTRVEPLLSSARESPELKQLHDQYTRAKSEYDAVDVEALRREKQTFRQGDGLATAEDTGDGISSSAPLLQHQKQSQVRVQNIRPIDLSEFHTEEAIQREKLQNAREIESDVMDLKTTYQEFHSLVNQQQEGLDIVTSNVAQSNNLVERGHGQIQRASTHQKRCRKIGCGVGILLVLVLIGVIIAVIVVTKK